MEFAFAGVEEALAAAYPDRPAVVQGARTLRRDALAERTRRLANALRRWGLGVHRERSELAPHESGQDHVALYLHDCPEYVEAMLGASKARVVPFNVNYRYVADELRFVLDSGRARAVIYHGAFTPLLAAVVPSLPELTVLLRVDDGSEYPLLPGAVDYEDALASAPAECPVADWSPDDLYILFTGGTTGFPKGVLWRQADIMVAGLRVQNFADGREWESMEELVAAAADPPAPRVLAAPPLMHGTGQWAALNAVLTGGTAVLPTVAERRDPLDILATAARERVTSLVIVGDAFARPLVDELRRGTYDLGDLKVIVNGGAILTAESKAALLKLLPAVSIIDSIGSSESGGQGGSRSSATSAVPAGCFRPSPGTVVVDEERRSVLAPGHQQPGWLATGGRIPLGYLGDPEKTARTFPVVAGTRLAVAGDRALHRADGLIQVLGRDSVTINSGGEKIFVEEVEAAILAEPGVIDAVVVGRPSERWGSEVVALVAVRDRQTVSADEVLATARQRLARYKLPKQVVFVDTIKRSPAGKADYVWAREVAVGKGEALVRMD